MRPTAPALCLLILAGAFSGAQEAAPRDEGAGSFWRAPKVELDRRALAPADVKLLAAPDRSIQYGLLQVDDFVPRVNFVPGNPRLVPLVADEDTGYRLVRAGLKAGVAPYGDRKYKVRDLPKPLEGLTLLQTKMGHKAILDARFSVVLAAARLCYVFVALDKRALGIYKRIGAPSWLQEYAPTGLKIATDEPIMNDVEAAYLVFVRKAPAGRVALGPPSMDTDRNAMYFAFFAEDPDAPPAPAAKP